MFRHVFRFYLSFVPATMAISIVCCYLYWQWGFPTLIPLTWFKLFTDVAIWYITKQVNGKRLYYYYNLNISDRKIWFFSFGFDFAILILLFIIIDPQTVSS